MSSAKINDNNIVSVLLIFSLIILAVLSAGGALLVSPGFGATVLMGGVLALANFLWLAEALRRVLQMEAGQARRFAHVRYLLRIAVMGCLLYILIVVFGVNIFGLLLGLSIVVFSISGLAIFKSIQKGG